MLFPSPKLLPDLPPQCSENSALLGVIWYEIFNKCTKDWYPFAFSVVFGKQSKMGDAKLELINKGSEPRFLR